MEEELRELQKDVKELLQIVRSLSSEMEPLLKLKPLLLKLIK